MFKMDTHVKNNICSIAQRQTCRHAAPVGHLNPTVCFFCNNHKLYRTYCTEKIPSKFTLCYNFGTLLKNIRFIHYQLSLYSSKHYNLNEMMDFHETRYKYYTTISSFIISNHHHHHHHELFMLNCQELFVMVLVCPCLLWSLCLVIPSATNKMQSLERVASYQTIPLIVLLVPIRWQVAVPSATCQVVDWQCMQGTNSLTNIRNYSSCIFHVYTTMAEIHTSALATTLIPLNTRSKRCVC